MAVLTLKEATELELVDRLKKRCEDVQNFSVRTINALLSDRNTDPTRITFIWELVQKTEDDLFRKRKNLGRKTLNEVKAVLREDFRLELNTRLTDALKRELGAPLTGDEPHEETETAKLNVALPLLEVLQARHAQLSIELSEAQEAFKHLEMFKRFGLGLLEADIQHAQNVLDLREKRIAALKHVIDNYTTIALALSS